MPGDDGFYGLPYGLWKPSPVCDDFRQDGTSSVSRLWVQLCVMRKAKLANLLFVRPLYVFVDGFESRPSRQF